MKSTQTKMGDARLTELGTGSWLEFAALFAAFLVVGAITFGLI